jgi:hypothetical protein
VFHLFKQPEKKNPIYARNDYFPNCCGINVITGFPHPTARTTTNNWGGINTLGYSDDKEECKHLIENSRSDVKIILKNSANSVMLVVLNHIQNKIYSDMLLQEGFKPIWENAYHSGHGHTLFIYAWNKYKTAKPTSHI